MGVEDPIITKRKEFNPSAVLPAHKEYVIDPAKAPFNSSVERDVSTIPPSRLYNPGPGMYNWDCGFDSARKKSQSLMFNILQKLQQSKAPFNS